MSPREKRIVQNETLFREVNKRIAELEDRKHDEETVVGRGAGYLIVEKDDGT